MKANVLPLKTRNTTALNKLLLTNKHVFLQTYCCRIPNNIQHICR